MCRRYPREASAGIGRCRTSRRACRCGRECQSQGSPWGPRAARKSRKSAWPAGGGRVARTEFTGLHDERRKKRYERPRETQDCETNGGGGRSSWLAHPSPRPRGIQAAPNCMRQYAQAKSCRDFEGSLRYSHAGVAEWQTRRTQNSNQGFPLSVLLCAEVQCYEAVASKLLVRCCDEL